MDPQTTRDPTRMKPAEIDSRSVFRIVAVAALALALVALLGLAVVEVRQTLRWLAAAVFMALALAPAVALVERIRVRGHHPPRWASILAVFVAVFGVFVFLVLHVIPPLVSEVEQLGSQAPGYVADFEAWADDSEAFREINHKYDLTATLNKQASELPARLGGAAGEVKVLTVSLLRNLLAAVTVAVLAFFLLLEGRGILDRGLARLGPEHAARGELIAGRVYGVVRGYVTVNLLLAVAAGLFTWGVLELLGVDIAVPLAIVVAFFDLVPLIGLTVGGLLVALAVAFHSFPTTLIIWAVAFLIYQQLQDRVIQPMLYGRAVRISPLVAIVSLLAGAQIAGILGALLAIPVAASIGVVLDELRTGDEETAPRTEPETDASGPGPSQPEPAPS